MYSHELLEAILSNQAEIEGRTREYISKRFDAVLERRFLILEAKIKEGLMEVLLQMLSAVKTTAIVAEMSAPSKASKQDSEEKHSHGAKPENGAPADRAQPQPPNCPEAAPSSSATGVLDRVDGKGAHTSGSHPLNAAASNAMSPDDAFEDGGVGDSEPPSSPLGALAHTSFHAHASPAYDSSDDDGGPSSSFARPRERRPPRWDLARVASIARAHRT